MPFQCHLARLAVPAQTIGANACRIARECSPSLPPLHLRRISDGHRLSIPLHFEKWILDRQKRAFISSEAQELAEILPWQRLPALLDGPAELWYIG